MKGDMIFSFLLRIIIVYGGEGLRGREGEFSDEGIGLWEG
jgi:hypothetical protein